MKGYEESDYSADSGVALYTGKMLQTIIKRDQSVAQMVLNNHFENFIDRYVFISSFDVQTLAFDTMCSLFVHNRSSDGAQVVSKMAALYVKDRYDQVFPRINKLLTSRNYYTCRQATKLLNAILFDPNKGTF